MEDGVTGSVCCEQSIVRPVMPDLDAIRGLAIFLVFWLHEFDSFSTGRVSSAILRSLTYDEVSTNRKTTGNKRRDTHEISSTR